MCDDLRWTTNIIIARYTPSFSTSKITSKDLLNDFNLLRGWIASEVVRYLNNRMILSTHMTLFSIKFPLSRSFTDVHVLVFVFLWRTAASCENKRKIYIINLKKRRVMDANDDESWRCVEKARPPVNRG